MSDTLAESLPAHSPLGPSAAEGWSTCADYVKANRGLPDYTIKVAAEGSVAHTFSDIAIRTGMDAEDFVGMTTKFEGYSFTWDDDDAMLLQRGIDEIREQTEADNITFFSELRVDVSPWTLPGQFGTLDRAYVGYDPVTEEWWVVICDLKWGRGIAVNPIENKQLILYALGFWRQHARHVIPEGVEPRFRLIIDQPRNAGGGGIWECTFQELIGYGDWLKLRAEATEAEVTPRTASLKGCMWCRRRRAPGGCDTFDEFMINLLSLTWDDIDMAILMSDEITLPRLLTPERRAWLLQHKNTIERWLAQLDEETMADALAGKPTGELKAVEGNKTPDKWPEDKDASVIPVVQKTIGDRGFRKMLKTPKQMAKEVDGDEEAQEAIMALVVKGTRKPILVHAADARGRITNAQTQFDEEDESGESA